MERADRLGALTEVPGELTRPYGSPSLLSALDAAAAWLEDAGLRTRRDAIGNVIGRRGDPDAPTVVLGSHLDSVRNAGRYDGPLGVLVAIAALAALRDEPLPFAVEIVCFADEEGLRYRASYLASRAYAGLLARDELALADADGVPLAAAIRAMRGDPDHVAGVSSFPAELAAYLEVHIEQGPVLQEEGLPVGIVTAIAGQSRGFVDLIGEAGHAGNTPPGLRRDTLPAAAELVLAVEREMHATPGLVATVGRIENHPNVGNVIPGLTTLSYDVRHQDDAVKHEAVDRLRAEAAAGCERRGLRLDWRNLQDHDAVPMSPRLRAVLARACTAAGTPALELGSGAGHDAVSIAHVTPEVSMLFVRCRDGISHHPSESVREDDVAVAIEVVVSFLRELARG